MLEEPQKREQEQPFKVIHQPAKRVLIVEDDADMGEALVAIFLVETDYQPLLVPTARQALDHMSRFQPDLLLLDYQLPDMNGLLLYDTLQTMAYPKPMRTLFLSANLPKDELHKRHLLGLEKPLDMDQFVEVVQAPLP